MAICHWHRITVFVTSKIYVQARYTESLRFYNLKHFVGYSSRSNEKKKRNQHFAKWYFCRDVILSRTFLLRKLPSMKCHFFLSQQARFEWPVRWMNEDLELKFTTWPSCFVISINSTRGYKSFYAYVPFCVLSLRSWEELGRRDYFRLVRKDEAHTRYKRNSIHVKSLRLSRQFVYEVAFKAIHFLGRCILSIVHSVSRHEFPSRDFWSLEIIRVLVNNPFK